MDENIEHKIVITFVDDGSVFYTMDVTGRIYAEQFLMLAHSFEYQGKRMKEDTRIAQLVAAEERRERAKKIVVPGVKDGVLRS